MDCRTCGTANAERSRFCGECGAALSRRCGECQADNPPSHRFCGECGAPLREPAAAQPSAGSRPPTPVPVIERRQLTLLFCDLVNSTMLAERLDPEELTEVMTAYQEACAATVQRFGGFVGKYLGDGVLAFFGYPRTQEDDAERAVRSGLALCIAVAGLAVRPDTRLEARIGIATGLVVVGDLIGDGATREQGVVGETPNLAARLQTAATPGSVVIDDGTRRLVGGLFTYRDLGLIALKGFARSIAAWEVLGESPVESRFEARHGASVPPLVGRDEELDLLLRRWGQVRGGEGRVVLITGEPGIGKSRVVREMQDRLASEACSRLGFFCSPHHRDSPLYPVSVQLERSAGILGDDSAATCLAKTASLVGSAAPAEEVALIAAQLGVSSGGRTALPDLAPQRRKERTLEALVRYVTRLAARNPTLLVFEDVHWIDATSLEFVTLLVECAAELPILLLATARPEFTPPWPAYAHARVLPLTRLSRREAAALATRVAGHKALPAELMAQILARTDGVPLFVEELTKTVLESGMVEEGVAEYVLAGPLRPLTIPTTLHASLMARLDRLAPAREIAQIGAAIGREFSYALLRLVAPIGEASMAAALEQLVGAELLFRRGEPPDAVYTFKHALVQDAAYDTLLRHRRHDLHGRIATVLEQHFPDIVSQQPEILARHSAEAGLMAQAVAYWARAGQRSLARSAMVEAAAQWRKGLELLATLPDDAPRQERELELQIGLGTALTATEGYAAAVTGATYRRARELCQALGRTEPLIAVLYGEWTHHIHRDELDRAHELAGEARRIAEARQDPSIRLMACRISGVTSFFRGALAECRAFQEEGLALFDPAQRPAYTGVADPRVISLAFLARALLLMGHVDRAQARIEEALAEAAQLSHAYTQSWALWQACFVDWMVRPVPVLLRRTEALIALSVDQHFRYSHAVGILFRGWCMSAEGRHEDSLVLLRQGLAEYRATGTVGYRAFFQTLLADACGKARQWEAGLAELVEAATLVETTNERWVEAEIHRVRGDLLVGAGHAGDAEASFHRAIKVAARQEAKLWQLRATVSLCRLLRNEGRHSQAGALLGSIYSEFEEGRATPPLLEAAALLAEFD